MYFKIYREQTLNDEIFISDLFWSNYLKHVSKQLMLLRVNGNSWMGLACKGLHLTSDLCVTVPYDRYAIGSYKNTGTENQFQEYISK